MRTPGDLTDAKENDYMGSRQYLQEWNHYRHILLRAGLRNQTFWLDVRGNHGGRADIRIMHLEI